jgi:lysophospholipase L1-like esterase
MPRNSLFTTAVVFTYMLLAQFIQAQDNNMTIGLIGDSTVATTYGWGPAFAFRVKDQVTMLNYAKNGATLDSLSKKLDALLKEKPNYVIIQFGHNDMKRYDPKVYGEKLKGYIERIIRAGSKPIVFSSVTRRNFDEKGKIKPTVFNERILPTYALSAKTIAKETHSLFLDLNAISIEHHNRIGPEESHTYNFKSKDTTHFSKKGAKEIANLIIKELKITVPALDEYWK